MKTFSPLLVLLVVFQVIIFISSYSTRRYIIKHRSGVKAFTKSSEGQDQTTVKNNFKDPPSSQQNGITVIAGFESFNVQLYRNVATAVT